MLDTYFENNTIKDENITYKLTKWNKAILK